MTEQRTWGGTRIPDGKEYHVIFHGKMWDRQQVTLMPTDTEGGDWLECDITDLRVEGKKGSRRVVITLTEREDSDQHGRSDD